MKHAICVIGYGSQANILQKTINVLDDKDIDFFIHWDAEYKIPNLQSNLSTIYFVKNRIAVKWGGQSQIVATLLLLKLVQKSISPYDYVHLISCNDIPLMTSDYFKNYFTDNTYIGFDNSFTGKDLKERIGFYYPGNIDFRRQKITAKAFKLANVVLNINRIKKYSKINFKKGPQWFSIKEKYVPEILNFDNSIFMHGYCADELLVQTILGKFESQEPKSDNDNYQATRYIDWNRGTPYVFTSKDVDELRKKVNTKFAFARKVYDPSIVDAIFKNIE